MISIIHVSTRYFMTLFFLLLGSTAHAQTSVGQNWAEWLKEQNTTDCAAKKLWEQFMANPDFESKHQDHVMTESTNYNGAKNVTEKRQIIDLVDRTVNSLNQGYTIRIRALEGVSRGQQIDLYFSSHQCNPSKAFVTCLAGNPKEPKQDFMFVKVKMKDGQCSEKSKPLAQQVYTCPIELRFCDFLEEGTKQ
jgi:hypothetical protein